MSYYTRTQSNPSNDNTATGASPIDRKDKIQFSVVYKPKFVLKSDELGMQRDVSVDDNNIEEKELDPGVEATLMDRNFRALSSL